MLLFLKLRNENKKKKPIVTFSRKHSKRATAFIILQYKDLLKYNFLTQSLYLILRKFLRKCDLFILVSSYYYL